MVLRAARSGTDRPAGWTDGDDSGWYSWGPLWNKADGLAGGCEYSGSYRHRLFFVFGSVALTFGAAAMLARRHDTWSTRHAALFPMVAVLAAVTGTAAWKANDAVYVRPVYDFSATTLDVEPIARLSQPGDEIEPWYRVAVTASSWPSTSTAVFGACWSEVVPESCELMWASGGFVTADADGDVDAVISASPMATSSLQASTANSAAGSANRGRQAPR